MGVESNNMQPAALNSHLKDKSYIGGFVPSQADITEFNALGCCPCGEKFPYAARWYCHVSSFNVAQRASLPGAASSAAPAAAAPAKAAAADDDCDLFGDDDEEEEEAKPKETPQEMAARKKAEAQAKKKKAAPVGKSTIVFDVKPACFDGDDDD